MKALVAACKPLILLDFHKSFNDTPTKRLKFELYLPNRRWIRISYLYRKSGFDPVSKIRQAFL